MRKTLLYLVILTFAKGLIIPTFAAHIPFYAEEHLQKGNEFFSQQNYELAIREYKDAILFAPEYDEAYFRLGYVYMVLNQFENAKTNFEKALELRGDYLEARYCMGQILQKMGKYEEARENSLKTVELFDENTSALVKLGTYTTLGTCCLEMNQPGKAIEYLEKALESSSAQHRVSILNNLGVAYVKKGDSISAKKYFEQAIDINPKYLPAHLGLARIYNKLGDKDKAIKIYERILKKYPSGQKEKEIDPYNPTARKLLGDIYMKQKKFEKALIQFEFLTKIEPKNANHYIDLGNVYNALKKYKIAIAAFMNAKNLEPANVYSSYYMAYSLENQKKVSKAIEVLKEIQDNAPVGLQARIHFRLASLYASKWNENLAYKHLKSAIQMDSTFKSNVKSDPYLKRYVKKSKFKKLVK